MVEALTITKALAAWIGHQRWFVGKGTSPSVRPVGSITLDSGPQLSVLIVLIADESETEDVLYQVPVVLRRVRREAGEASRIASVSDTEGGVWHLYDAPEDPAFTELLAGMIAQGKSVGDDLMTARGVPASPWPAGPMTSTVMRGEQSNTSVAYSPEGGSGSPSVICKIFRMLHDGQNPDVVLQSALFAAGSRSVPPIFGSIVAEWPDARQVGGRAQGHLAFAQRFLTGSVDAWELALAAGASLADFTASARQIGIATADVHATLAKALPTREATESDIESTALAWQGRLDAALAEVPDLALQRPSIELVYERAMSVPWPRLQSIHGDLHLGQILAVPDDSWVIIDFEGEPMRPLSERSQLDLPLRDVAGMLRSFDYAAGSQTFSPEVLEWAHECRAAFVDGYIAGSGRDVRRNRVLLDAFELDKALYEVVYEARNRPTWLPIPTNAVRRITDRVELARGR